MRIVRFQDAAGRTTWAAEQGDGSLLEIEGDVFSENRVTDCAMARASDSRRSIRAPSIASE